MVKYKVYSSYFDGQSMKTKNIGLVRADDLEEFTLYLKNAGFVGEFKENKGYYHLRLDPGRYWHHGDHSHEIAILPYDYKEPKTLFPGDWNDAVKSYNTPEYKQISPGYYWRIDRC